ncbi:hypothetical protein MMYC01_210089 [Madurella mycetomatis]|uniref:DUF6594 domain-containing protein n=1 Tax=Madurella mycetomatis TaxID=100816 RepID=A0A175VQL7_9PEZI|nr:hypothetical protein MMYC01_210089 [Madurella mycetomatis]
MFQNDAEPTVGREGVVNAHYGMGRAKVVWSETAHANTQQSGNARVRVQVSGLYHGTFSPDNATPCTLVLLTFRLDSLGRQHQFKRASIAAYFEDGQQRHQQDPEVLSLAPDGYVALTDSVAAMMTQDVGTDLDTQAQSVNAGYKFQRCSETPEKTSSSTVTGCRKFVSEDSAHPTGAEWILQENSITKTGIPSVSTFGLLLGPTYSGIRAKIRIETAERGGSLLRKAKGLFSQGFDVACFDLDPTTTQIGNHPLALSHIESLGELKMLALVDIGFGRVVVGEEGGMTGASLASLWAQEDDDATKDTEKKLLDCARGVYDAPWYKFRRFETLGLLNLYHYQDRLVRFEKDITGRRGHMDAEDAAELSTLLREYYGAIKSFRDISQMARPSELDQKLAAHILGDKLGERHYVSAGELGMVDLTPQALGVASDPVRILLQKFDPGAQRGHDDQPASAGQQEQLAGANLPPGKPNPAVKQISPTVDKLARLVVAIAGGAFLLAPMYGLTFMQTQRDRLITVGVFVVFFAVVVALASKATNQEVVGATAAYAAVLVVFVGQGPENA